MNKIIERKQYAIKIESDRLLKETKATEKLLTEKSYEALCEYEEAIVCRKLYSSKIRKANKEIKAEIENILTTLA